MTKKKDLKTLAIPYTRVSSSRQVREGHGLDAQEHRCREYAELKGYDVGPTFRDEGVSGGLIDRPGMQAMLALLKKESRHRECVVVIEEISRLARGLTAHLQLRSAIEAAGARLESPTIEFGTDSESILVENMLAAVSQYQREKNAEQVVNRMRDRVQQGYWVFYPPVGYRFEKVPGHGSMLVPDEPLASIVREGLEGYASRRFETIAEVMRFLERQPAGPRARGGGVHSQFVQEMLSRSLYAGYIDVPKWGISLLPAKHEPLISFETWQQIQGRLKAVSDSIAPARKDLSADFPLRGFVTCACCGKPMTAAWAKGRTASYAYYYCRNRQCAARSRTIRKERIEADFESLLRGLRPAPDLYFFVQEAMNDLWDQRLTAAKDRARELKAERIRTDRKVAQIMDRIVATDSPTLINAYESEIRKLEEQKAVLAEREAAAIQPQRSFDETFRTAWAFLANPWKLWASDEPEDKRIVLRLTFSDRLSYDHERGFQTVVPALPFAILADLRDQKNGMVEPRGVEPLTSALRTRRSPN